ncbi:MAG: hypothetical protein ABFC95_00500 [Smithella sp.]
MQIRVVKNDGTMEAYLHTKVLGTFNHAMAMVDNECLFAAEQLAEAVTFYIYRTGERATLSTDEIHLMIMSVLAGTGYGHAATALGQHRLNRRLARRRLEVIAEEADGGVRHEAWDKGRIARDLVEERRFDPLLARTIAGSVEEKALGMKISKIRKGLIRQLVTADTEALVEADCRLTATAS